jgi:Basic region leucine zipper
MTTSFCADPLSSSSSSCQILSLCKEDEAAFFGPSDSSGQLEDMDTFLMNILDNEGDEQENGPAVTVILSGDVPNPLKALEGVDDAVPEVLEPSPSLFEIAPSKLSRGSRPLMTFSSSSHPSALLKLSSAIQPVTSTSSPVDTSDAVAPAAAPVSPSFSGRKRLVDVAPKSTFVLGSSKKAKRRDTAPYCPAPVSSCSEAEEEEDEETASSTTEIGHASILDSTDATEDQNMEDDGHDNDDDEQVKRQRNRFHAHQSRIRRKGLTHDLQSALEELRRENHMLRSQIAQRCGGSDGGAQQIIDQQRANHTLSFIQQLQVPKNRIVKGKTLRFLRRLQKNLPASKYYHQGQGFLR